MKKNSAFLFLILSMSSFAQNVGINSSGAIPDASAGLDVNFTNKGLLIPRVNLSSTSDAVTIPTPATGLLVYNANASMTNGSVGYWYNSGTTIAPVWVSFALGGGNAWLIHGNSAITDGTHFLGTSSNVPLSFRVNNQKAGRIDNTLANTFFGYLAGNNTTSGTVNTAVGNEALYSNISGYSNTAAGAKALYSNSSGYQNTALGRQALLNNYDGNDNTATGLNALYANTSGDQNTANGIFALTNNVLGNQNTAVGYNSLQNTTGSSNTAIGAYSGNLITTGSFNVAIGNNAQVPNATGNNQVRIGSTGVTYAGVQVAWSITSDKRWKTNIEASTLGLKFIKELRPVVYLRQHDETKQTEYGFIAQEVEEVLVKHGITHTGIISKDDNGMYSLRYNDLIAILVNAIQEQQTTIEKQQSENNILNKKITLIENRLSMLEHAESASR